MHRTSLETAGKWTWKDIACYSKTLHLLCHDKYLLELLTCFTRVQSLEIIQKFISHKKDMEKGWKMEQ